MAYRRGSADRSRGQRLRAKSEERRRIKEALNNLELAKQHETRSREESGNLGGLIAALVAGFGLGAWDPSAIATAIAAGKAGGDAVYVHDHKDRTRISDAQDSLEALETESIFREERETASDAALAAAVSEDQISGGDLESGLWNFGSDWIEWYTLLSGLNKGYATAAETAAATANDPVVKKGILDRAGEHFGPKWWENI